ncbi:adenylate kinase [Chryseobacterium rhizosphaerae]|uniref:Adenylate kinase n=1 Tax=Chryseobacterium rhizosphaerae TaxID=395937 RepID=A0AAE3Y9Z7_9FLAO|nr:ATP-binding protein [Chryseobacterium rhizosphaerae]MDR6528268.1 adenylate kinase [Chryseobacterium rhizosphaerae]
MFDNIYFLGGIHGSGKGNTAKKILSKSNLIHLEASKVLKWEYISNRENKKVDNITFTQDKLIVNLGKIVTNNNQFLLDGHYCLINKQEEIEKVPLETFIKINPISLSIKIDEPTKIKKRLEQRDSKFYDLDFLIHFQDEEVKYAKFLADYLKKPLFVLNKDLENLLKHIKDENPS